MRILNGRDVVRNIRFWKGTAVAWLSPPSDFAVSVYLYLSHVQILEVYLIKYADTWRYPIESIFALCYI